MQPFLLYKLFVNFMKKLLFSIFFCLCNWCVVGQDLTTAQQASLDSAKAVVNKAEATKGKYDTLYARTLYNLAVLNHQFGKSTEGEGLLLEVMESYTAKGANMKAQRTMPYLNAVTTLADLYFDTERYEESLDMYKESLSIAQFLLPEYHDQYIYQLFRQLLISQLIGLHTEVDRKMVEIEKIYKTHQLQQRIDFVEVVLKKAEIMAGERQYYEALDLLENSQNKLAKGGYKSHTKKYNSQLLNQKLRAEIGKIYANLNQPAKAESYYKPLSAEKIANEKLYETIFLNLGLVLQKQKKYTEALAIFEKNKQTVSKKYGEKSPQTALAHTYLADLYAFQDKLPQAEGIYKQAIAILKENTDGREVEYATICNKLGNLYEEMFLYQSAIPLYAEALKIRGAELGEEHPDYLISLSNLATVYQKLQLYEKAEPYFREYMLALHKEITTKFSSLNDAEKASFYEGMKPTIENFMRYCIDRAGLNPYRPVPSFKQSSKILGDLFDLQLTTKAILLSSSTKVRQQILNSQDTMLVNQYKHWAKCKEQLTQYAMIKRSDLVSFGINIDSLRQVTNDLEKSLSLLSIDFAQEYTNVNLPTWKDIQKKLKADEAAVEIIQIPYRKDTTFYVALIVKPTTQNQPEVAFFANGAAMDLRFLKLYRNSIRYQLADKTTFMNYWHPIAEKLKGVRKVYLSPDGAYHQISLYTLLNPVSGNYLLEEIDIALLTNSKDMLADQTKDLIGNKTALLVGRPNYSVNQAVATTQTTQSRGAMREIMRGAAFSDLAGTEKEVKYIDSVLQANQWKTHLYVGNKADENAVKKSDSLWQHLQIQSPTILHIATHGFFVNSNNELSDPMLRSGIVLAGINNYLKNGEKLQNEDGILNAQEAMLLNLSHTELVILSACETGLGDVRQGEGVYGLQRALKLAGAKSIMMSLWKVDDLATAQLMSTFYTELMKGKTKIQAFRTAQLQVKANYKNPMYWGAFVMIGE